MRSKERTKESANERRIYAQSSVVPVLCMTWVARVKGVLFLTFK